MWNREDRVTEESYDKASQGAGNDLIPDAASTVSGL